MQVAIGLATIAFFVLPQSALAADSQKATLQTVTQQFQQSTALVITSARDFITKMNEVEQNKSLEERAFEHKPIDYGLIKQIQIVSPQELKVRSDAMSALSQYTLDLANLASGASLKTFGQNLQGLNKSLKQVATDAGSLPNVPADSFLKNKALPGIVTGAANAIGAIVALIEGRKAQKEIKQQILANKDELTAITKAIGEEMGLAFERRRDATSAHQRQLAIEYNGSLSSTNVFLSVLFADRLEASMAQMNALENTNPTNAVKAMQTALEAMIKYVSSGNKSDDLASLIAAVGSFSSAAQSSQAACATAK